MKHQEVIHVCRHTIMVSQMLQMCTYACCRPGGGEVQDTRQIQAHDHVAGPKLSKEAQPSHPRATQASEDPLVVATDKADNKSEPGHWKLSLHFRPSRQLAQTTFVVIARDSVKLLEAHFFFHRVVSALRNHPSMFCAPLHPAPYNHSSRRDARWQHALFLLRAQSTDHRNPIPKRSISPRRI